MTARQHDLERAPSTTHELSDVLTRVARQLQQEHGDVEATLSAITTAAVATVPGTEECGISYVIGRAKIEPRAATSVLPKQVDALQERLGEGPCMEAAWEQDVVRVDDMAAERRWPRFAEEAAAAGVGSMMCFQLFVEGDQLGALNLYSHREGAFDDDSQDVGRLMAAHAAIAIAGAEHEEHLRAGMNSRDLIGQAKGILMERHKLTADQAFGVLARASQEMNRKLVEVAREVTDTGAIPGGRRNR